MPLENKPELIPIIFDILFGKDGFTYSDLENYSKDNLICFSDVGKKKVQIIRECVAKYLMDSERD